MMKGVVGGTFTTYEAGVGVVVTGCRITSEGTVVVAGARCLKQYFSYAAPDDEVPYPHVFSAHWVKPVAPHRSIASDRCIHSQPAGHVMVCGVGVARAIVVCTWNADVVVVGRPRVDAASALRTIQEKQRTRITASENLRQQDDIREGWPMSIPR